MEEMNGSALQQLQRAYKQPQSQPDNEAAPVLHNQTSTIAVPPTTQSSGLHRPNTPTQNPTNEADIMSQRAEREDPRRQTRESGRTRSPSEIFWGLPPLMGIALDACVQPM